MEALAFDSGVTSHRKEIGRDTTTATPCGQNSAMSQMEQNVRIDEEVNSTYIARVNGS